MAGFLCRNTLLAIVPLQRVAGRSDLAVERPASRISPSHALQAARSSIQHSGTMLERRLMSISHVFVDMDVYFSLQLISLTLMKTWSH